MMKKDIEWLKDRILTSQETHVTERDSFDIDSGARRFYNGALSSISLTLDLINQLDEPKELPVIPEYVAEYVELAKSDVTLKRVMELANTRYELPRWEKEYDWISENSETFARAWLDGYEVEEEPLYCALIKGHEIVVDDDTLTFKYWNFDTFNGDLFPSNRFSRDGRFLTEMSKSEWNKVGINSSNADFVKVNE